MVSIRNFNDKEIELKFGIGALTAIDKELGLEVEKVNLGEGLEMLVPKLTTGNVIGIAKVITAVLPKKERPKTEEDLETVLEYILDDFETFELFGAECLKVLKEGRITRGLVKDEA